MQLLANLFRSTPALRSAFSDPTMLRLRSLSLTPPSFLFSPSFHALPSAFSGARRLSTRKLKFQDDDRHKSILALFREFNISEDQLSKMVRKLPSLITNRTRTPADLAPKLQFFVSIGLSGKDLGDFLTSNPGVLHLNLQNNIVPKYHFLTNMGVKKEDAIRFMKRSNWTYTKNLKVVAANAAYLKSLGVDASRISFLVGRHSTICQTAAKISSKVSKLLEMGFKPSTLVFLNALQALCQTKEATRREKIKLYKKWGWSEEDVVGAFKWSPEILRFSKAHIEEVFEFVVKLGWEPKLLAKAPSAFYLNFKERVVPRFSVLKLLQVRGLVKDVSICKALNHTNVEFEKRFVKKYADVPGLMDVYKRKVRSDEVED